MGHLSLLDNWHTQETWYPQGWFTLQWSSFQSVSWKLQTSSDPGANPLGTLRNECLVQNIMQYIYIYISDYFTEKKQNYLVRGYSYGFYQKIWCSQRLKLKKKNVTELFPLWKFSEVSEGSHWPHQIQLQMAKEASSEDDEQARSIWNVIHSLVYLFVHQTFMECLAMRNTGIQKGTRRTQPWLYGAQNLDRIGMIIWIIWTHKRRD